MTAIRAAEISMSTSAEEADEATKLPQFTKLTLISKHSSVISATTQNLPKGVRTTYVCEALT